MDLKNGYEETLWMLFCQELSLYVTVESLHGGPYIKLEEVGSRGSLRGFNGYGISNLQEALCYFPGERKEEFKEFLKQFTLYYLQNGHLSFNYMERKFKPGMPYFDFMIDISNSFIEFFNTQGHREDKDMLFDRKVVAEAFAANDKFYNIGETPHDDFSQYEGQRILTFKGEDKLLRIERGEEVQMETTLLLQQKIAMFILCSILKIVNYRYRNGYNQNTREDSSSSSTYQTVCYL